MAKGTTTRTLFINRLKREGRGAEWRRRYKEAKKECDGWKEASDKVMAEMGFVSAAVEREIHERFLKFGMAGIPEQLESIQQDKEQTELIEILGEYDINDSEMTNWKAKPDDAPTPGAWNILIWKSTRLPPYCLNAGINRAFSRNRRMSPNRSKTNKKTCKSVFLN